MEIRDTAPKTVYLNGRFLTQSITGVQRTAYEIVLALDELLSNGEIDPLKWNFVLIYSGILINEIPLKHIRLKKKGVLKGNLWEQIELPVYTWGNLLVSMCTMSCLIKTKQFVFVHDAAFLVNPKSFSWAFRTWYKFAVRILGKVSLRIITVSEFSKKQLVKYAGFKKRKVSIIHNAGEHILRFAEPDDDFKKRISDLQPYCLAVSSLSPNKNFKGLNKAIKLIDFDRYNMLIAGGIMSTLKHDAPNDAVTYLGYVSNAELKHLYANASLFIFPSFYEGFGIPPLEAMVSGCPVLSSNTSAMPEILGESCVYCDPADYRTIADSIDSLINNPNYLNTLKLKGYSKAAEYSWAKSAFKLFLLIQKHS